MGLDESLLVERAAWVVGIPMLGEVRSLNLANSVAIAVYEALRQQGALQIPLTPDSRPPDEPGNAE